MDEDFQAAEPGLHRARHALTCTRRTAQVFTREVRVGIRGEVRLEQDHHVGYFPSLVVSETAVLTVGGQPRRVPGAGCGDHLGQKDRSGDGMCRAVHLPGVPEGQAGGS